MAKEHLISLLAAAGIAASGTAQAEDNTDSPSIQQLQEDSLESMADVTTGITSEDNIEKAKNEARRTSNASFFYPTREAMRNIPSDANIFSDSFLENMPDLGTIVDSIKDKGAEFLPVYIAAQGKGNSGLLGRDITYANALNLHVDPQFLNKDHEGLLKDMVVMMHYINRKGYESETRSPGPLNVSKPFKKYYANNPDREPVLERDNIEIRWKGDSPNEISDIIYNGKNYVNGGKIPNRRGHLRTLSSKRGRKGALLARGETVWEKGDQRDMEFKGDSFTFPYFLLKGSGISEEIDKKMGVKVTSYRIEEGKKKELESIEVNNVFTDTDLYTFDVPQGEDVHFEAELIADDGMFYKPAITGDIRASKNCDDKCGSIYTTDSDNELEQKFTFSTDDNDKKPVLRLDFTANGGNEIASKSFGIAIKGNESEQEEIIDPRPCPECPTDEESKQPNKFSRSQPFVNMVPSTTGWISAYLDAMYGITHPGRLTGQGGMSDASNFLDDGAANRHMLDSNALVRARHPFGDINLALDVLGGVDSEFGNMSLVDAQGNNITFNGNYMDIVRGRVGGGIALEAPNINGVDILLAGHAGPIFSSIDYDLSATEDRTLALSGEGQGKGFFADAEARMAYENFAADLKFGFSRNTDEVAVQRLLRGHPLFNPDGSDTTNIKRVQDNFRIDVDTRYLVNGLLGPYLGGTFARENITSSGPEGTDILSESAGLAQIRGGLELDLGEYFAMRPFYGYDFMNDQHSAGLNLWTFDRQLGLYIMANFDPGSATRTSQPSVMVGVGGTFDFWAPDNYNEEKSEAEENYQRQDEQYQESIADRENGIVCNPDGTPKLCEYDTMDVCNENYPLDDGKGGSCRYASEEEAQELSDDQLINVPSSGRGETE